MIVNAKEKLNRLRMIVSRSEIELSYNIYKIKYTRLIEFLCFFSQIFEMFAIEFGRRVLVKFEFFVKEISLKIEFNKGIYQVTVKWNKLFGIGYFENCRLVDNVWN